MSASACYRSPLGLLEIGYEQDFVTSIRLLSQPMGNHSPTPLTDLAAVQILEFMEGSRKDFTFPIHPKGTPFQIAVWSELRKIPCGQTRTYGQIAAAIGKPGAARAVGQAANRNPIWIVIPCHRVVGANGKLTGYAGGLDLKQKLLDLEQLHK